MVMQIKLIVVVVVIQSWRQCYESGRPPDEDTLAITVLVSTAVKTSRSIQSDFVARDQPRSQGLSLPAPLLSLWGAGERDPGNEVGAR